MGRQGLPARALLLILLACLLALPRVAGADAPVVQMAPKSGSLPMGRFIELLEDPAGKLTLDDVRAAPLAGQFRPSGAEQVNIGYSNSAWWLRFCLRASPDMPRNLLLEVRFPSVDLVEMHAPVVAPDGRVTYRSSRAGDIFPWASREVPHRNHVLNLPVAQGENYVYLRVTSESVLTLPIYLWQPEAFEEYNYDNQMLLGGFYGLIFALVIYNLMLFLSLRDRVYLYYVLYTAVFGIYLFSYDGYSYQYLWPESTWWANHAPATTLSLVLMLGAVFARSFLVLHKVAPVIDKVVLASGVMGGAFAVMAATGTVLAYGMILRTLTIVGALSALVTLYVCVREVLRGYRPAKFFLLAWSGLLVFILLGTLRNYALAPANFATIYCLHIGLMLDVLLLSFGLADRINTIKREKETAQAEALANQRALLETTLRNERELEQRVSERTEELNVVNERLRVEAHGREELLVQLRESEERMRFMAQHDALTGLPNRYSMQERLSLAIELSRRNRKKLAVMLIDLDGFKSVNDTRGHPAGDQLLVTVAARLRTSMRASDTVARYGGDEFVVLASELDRAEDAGMVAEKIADMVSLPVPLQGGPCSVGCSIGISVFPDHAEDAEQLLLLADNAMYQRKAVRDQRNRFAFYDAG